MEFSSRGVMSVLTVFRSESILDFQIRGAHGMWIPGGD